MTLKKDDAAAIHVVEAVLAGIIMLTAVLFMTTISAPSPSQSETGIDLEDVASDTLRVLQTRPAEDPVTYDNRLEEMVSLALEGDVTDSESFLGSLIPTGHRYLLRLDNGVEEIPLIPQGSGVVVTPRAARAAEVFLLPDWQTVADDPGTYVCGTTLGPYDVGDSGYAIVGGQNLVGPNGATAPGGIGWSQWWLDNQDTGLPIPIADQVPRAAPYGKWIVTDTNTCFYVTPPDRPSTDYPVYGIQLVVWPIA